jgi:hypothetical protein
MVVATNHLGVVMTITADDVDTKVGEDEDIIVETFEQFGVPCDGAYENIDCENEAKFSLHMVCCGDRLLECEDCMLILMNLSKKLEETRRCMACAVCGTHSHTNGFQTIKLDGPL